MEMEKFDKRLDVIQERIEHTNSMLAEMQEDRHKETTKINKQLQKMIQLQTSMRRDLQSILQRMDNADAEIAVLKAVK